MLCNDSVAYLQCTLCSAMAQAYKTQDQDFSDCWLKEHWQGHHDKYEYSPTGGLLTSICQERQADVASL